MAKTCDFSRTKDSIKAWYKTNKLVDDFNNILNLDKFRTKVTEHSNEIVREFNLPLERIYNEEEGGRKAIMNYSYLAKVDAVKKKRKAELDKALLKAQSEQFNNISDVTISNSEDERINEDLQEYLNNIKTKEISKFLEEFPRTELAIEHSKGLIKQINETTPQYIISSLPELIKHFSESETFVEDLKKSPGKYPYKNLHKQVSTELLQLSGYIPHTTSFNQAMQDVFGYEYVKLTEYDKLEIETVNNLVSEEVEINYLDEYISTGAGTSGFSPIVNSKLVDNSPTDIFNIRYALSEDLLRRITKKTFNEVIESSNFTEIDKRKALMHTIRERLDTRNTFNGRLYQKLKNNIKLITGSESSFSTSGTTLNVDINNIVKELNKFEGNKSSYLDLILGESLIRVAVNTVTNNENISKFSTEVINNPNKLYKEINLPFYDQIDFYETVLKTYNLLEEVFIKPNSKRELKEFVSFVEKQLKDLNSKVDFITEMEYKTTPELWEISDSVEQYNNFKKKQSKNITFEELIEKYKEFVVLEDSKDKTNLEIPCL